MSRAEYMRIHLKYLPPDIRYRYHIDVLVASYGCVYKKIIKGMYGLKQTVIIAYNRLISHMVPHGYYPVPFKTGLWSHKTTGTKHFLYVDDFGVKYFTKDDTDHLIDSLKITMQFQHIGRVSITLD